MGRRYEGRVLQRKAENGHSYMDITLVNKKCNSKPQGDTTSYPPEWQELKLQKISMNKEERNWNLPSFLMKL